MTVVVLVALMLPRKSSTRDVALDKAVTHSKSEKAPLAQRISAYLSEVRRSLSVSPLMFPAMFAQTFALGILTPILTLYAKEVLKLSSFEYSMFWLQEEPLRSFA